MKNCAFFLPLLLVSVVSLQGIGGSNSYPADPSDKNPASVSLARQRQEELQERRKRNFEVASNLLRRKGVSFEPEALLQDGWQETLAPAFAQMPEMREVRYLAKPLDGVELADTLYLPEKV